MDWTGAGKILPIRALRVLAVSGQDAILQLADCFLKLLLYQFSFQKGWAKFCNLAQYSLEL
ncbi:MAG: hypothetical protein JWQ14_2630 [Adhaeribacter sp.]|nr:hypothetical protein [Adhaeribacter sp.]